MFKVDVVEFQEGARELLQVTQDIRVATSRTTAAIAAFLPGTAGGWAKTASFKTDKFKRDLESLQDTLQKTTDGFNGANEEISGPLRAKYEAIGLAANASIQNRVLAYHGQDAQMLSNCHGSLTSGSGSTQNLSNAIQQVKTDASGLENSYGITYPLDLMATDVASARRVVQDTYSNFQTYEAAVKSFEETYAKALDPKVMFPGVLDAIGGLLSTGKGLTGIFKHGVGIGTLVSSLVDSSYKYKSTLPPLMHPGLKNYFKSAMKDGSRAGLEGLKSTFDCLKPSEWKSNWDALKTGVAASKRAGKDGVESAFRTTIGKGGEASKLTTRLAAGGKLVGYAADVMALAGVGVKSVNAGVKYKGDAADKVAAGGVEAVKGIAKFAVGKAAGKAGSAIGATLGSAILPPVGTIVGGVIGGAIAGWGATTLMNMGEAALKNCGAHDAVVKGFGMVNRAVGGFVSSGFKMVKSIFG